MRYLKLGRATNIIPIKGYIQATEGDGLGKKLLELFLEALRKSIAPGLDTDENPRTLRKRLGYLGGHPFDRAANKRTLGNNPFHHRQR